MTKATANGTLAQLQAVADPFDLDALVLTHLHPDHCADVSALTVLRRYHPAPPYPARPRLRARKKQRSRGRCDRRECWLWRWP